MNQTAEFYFERAYNKYKNNDVEGSFNDLDEAVRLDPENTLYYMTRGLQRHYRQEYELSLPDFTRIIELSGDLDELAEAYLNRSTCYQVLGQRDDLLGDLTWLIENGKADARIYERRGDCYRALGYPKEARADFTTAFQLIPRQDNTIWLIHVLLSRAHTAYQAKQYEDAVNDFTEILASGTDNLSFLSNAYGWRGKAYYKLNKLTEALADFNQMRVVNGDTPSSDLSHYTDLIRDV